MLTLYDRKYPRTLTKHVGIEIEFFISDVNKLKLEAYFRENKLVKNIHIGEDGSLELKKEEDVGYIKKYNKRKPYSWEDPEDLICNQDERRRGCEIRVLATEKTAPDIINLVCIGIKKFEGIINDTCGLHVHLDMRNRHFDLVFNNLIQYQDLLYSTQSKKRRKSTYCQKINDPQDPMLDTSKYYGINKRAMLEHKTIEIRMHEGSIEEKEIKRWLYLLIKIASLDTRLREPAIDFSALKLHSIVKGYLNARIKKFA